MLVLVSSPFSSRYKNMSQVEGYMHEFRERALPIDSFIMDYGKKSSLCFIWPEHDSTELYKSTESSFSIKSFMVIT